MPDHIRGEVFWDPFRISEAEADTQRGGKCGGHNEAIDGLTVRFLVCLSVDGQIGSKDGNTTRGWTYG